MPAVGNGRSLSNLTVYEEEQFILEDRTAERHTVNSLPVSGTCAGNLLLLNSVTTHILVLVIDVSRTLESVSTRLSDSVDTTTDEVSLADIIRRNNDLQLLDSIDRNRVAATREVIAQTEVVVEIGTIDREVGSTSVRTGEAHLVTAVR